MFKTEKGLHIHIGKCMEFNSGQRAEKENKLKRIIKHQRMVSVMSVEHHSPVRKDWNGMLKNAQQGGIISTIKEFLLLLI